MILDTTFLIDLMMGDTAAHTKLNGFIKEGEPQLVTVLSIFELFSGVARSDRPESEKNKIARILVGQVIVDLDRRSAAEAGEIDGSLIKKGERIDVIDTLIASIALQRGEVVLTRNHKDFSKIRGLDIEGY